MPKWIKRGTVIRAAADLLEESKPYFDDSLVAISFEREEEEL